MPAQSGLQRGKRTPGEEQFPVRCRPWRGRAGDDGVVDRFGCCGHDAGLLSDVRVWVSDERVCAWVQGLWCWWSEAGAEGYRLGSGDDALAYVAELFDGQVDFVSWLKPAPE